MVLQRYDQILISTAKQCKAYGVQRLPLNMVNLILDNAKFEDEVAVGPLKPFVENFNKTIDSVRYFAKENSQIIGDGRISYTELKQWIDKLRIAFIQAQNQPAHESGN